jgi:HSP20 family protein
MLLRNATVRELNQLTARVFDARTTGARLDAYRIDDTFHLDIDLPGVDPADLDITVDRKVLTVRCQRKHAEGEAGPASRQVFLSDSLDTDRLDARYEDGVLTLRIPVKQADPGPEISARTGTS